LGKNVSYGTPSHRITLIGSVCMLISLHIVASIVQQWTLSTL